jgi:hypothetical protein
MIQSERGRRRTDLVYHHPPELLDEHESEEWKRERLIDLSDGEEGGGCGK